MNSDDHAPAHHRRTRGSGTQREIRPGVWEVRVPVGPAGNGPVARRSITVRGTKADADAVRLDLLAQVAAQRQDLPLPRRLPPATLITVAELLPAWLHADHPWKPSTLVGYRSVVRALLADPVAQLREMALSPRVLRDHVDRWTRAGVSCSVSAARFRVLRSAVGWRGTNGSSMSTRSGSCADPAGSHRDGR